MTLKDEIKEAVNLIFYSPATNGQDKKSLKNGEDLINKLISSACKSQRNICQRINDAEKDGTIDAVIGKVYANAPFPSEVERCYSGKEVAEIATKAWRLADKGENLGLSMGILSKEYGIIL